MVTDSIIIMEEIKKIDAMDRQLFVILSEKAGYNLHIYYD